MSRKKKTLSSNAFNTSVVEALEPRILLSADLPGLDLPEPDPGDRLDLVAERLVAEATKALADKADVVENDPTSAFLIDKRSSVEIKDHTDPLVALEPEQLEELLATGRTEQQVLPQPNTDDSAAATRTSELVVVDSATPDYQQLIDDLQSQVGSGRQFEVVLIERWEDGIDRLGDILAGYSDLDAVHLISHASDGAVALGAATLDFDSLLDNAKAIKRWGSAFSEDGDLLIYGCDLAAGAEGEALVDALSRLTGADVAASDDLTGHANLGGDWDLEYQQGQVETTVVASAVNANDWYAVLPTYPASNALFNDEEWITNVSFGDIDNSSGQDSGGYGDYTLQSTTVTQGTSTDLSVTISLISATPDDFITAWVDWNQDGDFEDAGEEYVVVENTVTDGPHTASITVPNDAALGSTQMRVSLKYFSAPPSFGTFNWGEVEDYTVNVAAAVNDAPVNSVPVAQATSQDTALVFSSGNGNAISVSDADAGGSPIEVTLSVSNGTLTLANPPGPVGGETLANTTTGTTISNSTIAYADDGSYVAVWADESLDGDMAGIFMQRFDSSGNPLGIETQVNTETADAHRAWGSTAQRVD